MADMQKLTAHLDRAAQPRLVLSLSEIEGIIGGPLPPSAHKYPTFWSNSEQNSYARSWLKAGYRVSRRGLPAGQVAFVRSLTEFPVADPLSRPAPAMGPRAVTRGKDGSEADVVLIGCVKTKADGPARARDLYTSPLFARRRAYAEHGGRPWFILSARHGLLRPDELIEPYDVALKDQPPAYRQAWGRWVVVRLEQELGPLTGRVMEVHAGSAYVEAIRDPLEGAGARMLVRLEGLRQGEQLAWYDDRPTHARAAEVSDPLDVVGGPVAVGAFDYRWPESVQHFEGGWEVRVSVGGVVRRIHHALGRKVVFGRDRRASVTWLDGQPVAEGTEAEDFATTRALCSLVKDETGRSVRAGTPPPAGYSGFPLVRFDEEVRGPYSQGAVAVKLAEDDVLGWARLVLARRGLLTRVPETLAPASVTEVAAPSVATASAAGRVVERLLRLGTERVTTERIPGPTFTPNEAANRFLMQDDFAFLVAVIFDQGIVAERAWEAPYLLHERLGHLDPGLLAHDLAGVRAAVGQRPMLHRFVENVPRWVCEAAKIVVDRYGGDAGRIWADEPTARELFARLDAFPGIGQKKAAMAVEILAEDRGVPVRELSGSDIAYDVHVRRVFLRTGLAQRDDVTHMLDVARRAHPERPGALDEPAWRVGRQWCHAGSPDCSACALGDVCPKLIDAAGGVKGV